LNLNFQKKRKKTNVVEIEGFQDDLAVATGNWQLAMWSGVETVLASWIPTCLPASVNVRGGNPRSG